MVQTPANMDADGSQSLLGSPNHVTPALPAPSDSAAHGRMASSCTPRTRTRPRTPDLVREARPSGSVEFANDRPSTMNGIDTALQPGRASSKRKATSPISIHGTSSSSSHTSGPRRSRTDRVFIKSKDMFGTSDPLPATDQLRVGFPEDPVTYRSIIRERIAGNRPIRPLPDLDSDEEDVTTLAASLKEPEKQPKLSAILVSNFAEQIGGEVGNSSNAASYLPLCKGRDPSLSPTDGHTYVVLPGFVEDAEMDVIMRKVSTRVTWPSYRIPTEVFSLITQHLPRDSVKSLRLVNKEFEEKVSGNVFHTSTVPFNTELYDMIDENTRNVSGTLSRRVLGKGKAVAQSKEDKPDILDWQNAKNDSDGKVYKGHGLRVFQGFGPHIKRFGMTFEVAEAQLARPQTKKELDCVDSYFGAYEWPPPQYTRFANLAGLERTADETSRMKAAFSQLHAVKELALSIDSGLGWLNGPDKSYRARIFEQPFPVFGNSQFETEHQLKAAKSFWAALKMSQTLTSPDNTNKEVTMGYVDLKKTPADLIGLAGTCHDDVRKWPSIEASRFGQFKDHNLVCKEGTLGLIFTTSGARDGSITLTNSSVIPGTLRKEQKEWLLEMEWAQRAFLESYMLAVVDNPGIFHPVRSLNIAKLSSIFLPVIAGEQFWSNLPCLEDVTLHVSPVWRSVDKDNAGQAEMTDCDPSEVVNLFHLVVERRLIASKCIKRLQIGWIGGGEHAEGMFARNNHLLPAPITTRDMSTSSIVSSQSHCSVFTELEQLTLSNCWITPSALLDLVTKHRDKALKKLVLNSVSLTADPRIPSTNQVGQQPLPAIAGVALPAPPVPQNLAQMQAMNQMAQQMQMQMQQFLVGAPAVQGQLPFPPVPALAQFAAANAPAPQSYAHWTAGHRIYSWPDILNTISPGPIFTDYLAAPEAWEEQYPPRPETNLRSIEFISCGYARLPSTAPFDQASIEPDWTRAHTLTAWFRVRHVNLKPLMMEHRDAWMAQVVQYMPQRELDALLFAWGMRSGWEDAFAAEGPEFDGQLPGGTGRFSGLIVKDMGLVSQTRRPQA